jgi:hypothetical protein
MTEVSTRLFEKLSEKLTRAVTTFNNGRATELLAHAHFIRLIFVISGNESDEMPAPFLGVRRHPAKHRVGTSHLYRLGETTVMEYQVKYRQHDGGGAAPRITKLRTQTSGDGASDRSPKRDTMLAHKQLRGFCRYGRTFLTKQISVLQLAYLWSNMFKDDMGYQL